MIKTVTLNGGEFKAEDLGGFNTFVQNLSGNVMFASKYPNISAGADDVAEIPAGCGKLISTTNGTIYLLGTGKAELTGLDSDGVIATGGGASYSGGDDGSSFAGILDYVDSHDKTTLNSAKEYADRIAQDKADKSEIPTSLPADGGNADTVNGFTVGCDIPENTMTVISGKMDAQNPTGTRAFSLNRKKDSIIGKYSFAEGHNAIASGDSSHAEGYETTASGNASHAEGYETTASGQNSHAGGCRTTASNYGSVSFGKCSKPMTDGADLLNTSVGDVLVIGNGIGIVSKNFSNAFRITYEGEVYSAGNYNSSGADYAEFIKPWFDNNPDGEDRVGYFVTIKDSKLRFAEPGDYIVGITSGNPSVVGNGDEDWLGRWQRDEFNRIIREDVEKEIEKIDGETGEIAYEKTGKIIKNARFKQNPNYDPDKKYVERKDRPEWDYVGMIGVLPLRDDGTCAAGGFAKCGAGGIATAADEWECHKTFFVIERINDHIISVEMR